MSKVDQKKLIRRNRFLRVLLEEQNLSLVELSRRTGMTLPMVSSLADELRKQKYILTQTTSTQVRAGRPPVIVHINGNAGFVVGIDLGHRNTNIIAMNLRQEIVYEQTVPSHSLNNDPKIMQWLKEILEVSVKEAGIKRRLLGVGLSIPGIVRGREGVSVTYLNFGDTSLRDTLRQRFKVPVHIEHDAKAMALGERWFGAAKDVQDALSLNVGWGLGLGIILDGKIYYGRDGYAGEFGHIQIVPNGLRCYCGKRGCLETVASGMAIGREARTMIDKGAESILKEDSRGKTSHIDAAMVVKAAVKGDIFAIEILESAGRHLGRGLAQLINLLNPERIILGGRVSLAGKLFLEPIRSSAFKYALLPLGNNVEFVISSLGPKSGALGVAMLAMRDLFEVDHLNPSSFV